MEEYFKKEQERKKQTESAKEEIRLLKEQIKELEPEYAEWDGKARKAYGKDVRANAERGKIFMKINRLKSDLRVAERRLPSAKMLDEDLEGVYRYFVSPD